MESLLFDRPPILDLIHPLTRRRAPCSCRDEALSSILELLLVSTDILDILDASLASFAASRASLAAETASFEAEVAPRLSLMASTAALVDIADSWTDAATFSTAAATACALSNCGTEFSVLLSRILSPLSFGVSELPRTASFIASIDDLPNSRTASSFRRIFSLISPVSVKSTCLPSLV